MFNSDKCECNASCYHECMCDWVVKKEWQGLTAEEIASIPLNENTVQAVENLLREKNNDQ